jgi:hypothetical protein
MGLAFFELLQMLFGLLMSGGSVEIELGKTGPVWSIQDKF